MGITERIDKITDVSTILSADPPIPRSVKIELTGKCNFNCVFCARSAELREQQHMHRGLYEILVSELRAEGVEELGLFYLGESFMVPWLDKAVEFAKRVGFPYIFLTTNGSLAKPNRVKKLMQCGLDSLKFSLNYSSAQQFTEIAKVDPRLFDIVIANVKAARRVRDEVEQESGHRCGLYASYIQYDGEQRERMLDVVKEVGPYLDEVYALPLYSQAELVGESGRALGWDVTTGNRGRVGALRPPLPCWAVMSEGHITFDGKLSACCFDHDGRFIMGDLVRQSFAEAWHSPSFVALREAHLSGDVRNTPCAECAAYNK